MRASGASVGLALAVVTMAVASLTILLLLLDGDHPGFLSYEKDMRLFQRSVGGLGMGAAATPAWNVLHYDPRLQPVDDSNLWPIAGSYPYSPSAVSTVVAFRELPREDLKIIKVDK